MIDGITSLRDGPLLVASDQLISLMEQIPIILEAHAEKSDEIEELIDDFKGDAKTCVDHAQEGFVVAPTIEKQIRSVQLCVSAYIATKCCYEGRPRLLQQLRGSTSSPRYSSSSSSTVSCQTPVTSSAL